MFSNSRREACSAIRTLIIEEFDFNEFKKYLKVTRQKTWSSRLFVNYSYLFATEKVLSLLNKEIKTLLIIPKGGKKQTNCFYGRYCFWNSSIVKYSRAECLLQVL